MRARAPRTLGARTTVIAVHTWHDACVAVAVGGRVLLALEQQGQDLRTLARAAASRDSAEWANVLAVLQKRGHPPQPTPSVIMDSMMARECNHALLNGHLQ